MCDASLQNVLLENLFYGLTCNLVFCISDKLNYNISVMFNFQPIFHYVVFRWRFRCNLCYEEKWVHHVSLLWTGKCLWPVMLVLDSFRKSNILVCGFLHFHVLRSCSIAVDLKHSGGQDTWNTSAVHYAVLLIFSFAWPPHDRIIVFCFSIYIVWDIDLLNIQYENHLKLGYVLFGKWNISSFSVPLLSICKFQLPIAYLNYRFLFQTAVVFRF